MREATQPVPPRDGIPAPGASVHDRWRGELPALAKRFRENRPTPHIVIDEFLPATIANEVLEQFPSPAAGNWIHYKHYNERTLGNFTKEDFPPAIDQLIDELCSADFVEWLSQLTGIAGLKADPDLEGGGMHQTEAGGFQKLHLDFHGHPHKKTWRRRCNLLLYLNRGWNEEWGGSLELWDPQRTGCVARVAPHFNRLFVFSVGEDTFHGYPEPLRCPPSVTRKSIALYYYTVESDLDSVSNPTRHFASYYPSPGDSGLGKLLIRVDNACLVLYARLKRKFGLSDGFASWVMKIFSGRRG